jgi:hypothetical protein
MNETKIDKECDVGDECFLSGYETDDSDWSIGWLEPLGTDFENNDDDDEIGTHLSDEKRFVS